MVTPSTIFAPATAAGKSGVAVLRISGPGAAGTLESFGISPLPSPRVAKYAALRGADGSIIDHALILWFPAPASFTGEDVAELHLHGSRAVLKAVLSYLSALPGLRLAEPGEFSRRAYLNGKLDLTAIEGLADLIDAETEAQRRQSLAALSGQQGTGFMALRARIVHALAHMEAYIDFPDEDIPPEVLAGICADVTGLMADIQALLADERRGERIREGIRVVILGAPNAGKSTLLNALARRDAAIVSPTPGTTRDVIEVPLDLGGYAVTLIDTAGLRDSTDSVEQEGIRRSHTQAKHADVKLVLFDGSTLPALDAESVAMLDAKSLAIVTKQELHPAPCPETIGDSPALSLSAHTGHGVDSLLAWLTDRITADFAGATHAPLITRQRHRVALTLALHHLELFLKRNAQELACEELRLAASEIGKITGIIPVDELLDHIFRDFCIGK